MNKESCNDRAGKSHFGDYGWYDGYTGSIRNCRIELKMRGSCCSDADACAECSRMKIREGKGNTQTDIVSQNIHNMQLGERDKEREIKEDKELSAKRREDEVRQLAERKARDEAAKEGKIICAHCKEKVDPKGIAEVKQGIIACPKCATKINGQTGVVILGEEVEPKKDEPKKEVKPDEPQVPKTDTNTKPESTTTAPTTTVDNKPTDANSAEPKVEATKPV